MKSKPTDAPILFFWLQEDTEVWAAHSLEQFAECIRKTVLGDDSPRFDATDKGEQWDEYHPKEDERIIHEDGSRKTYMETALASPSLPWPLTTAYA